MITDDLFNLDVDDLELQKYVFDAAIQTKQYKNECIDACFKYINNLVSEFQTAIYNEEEYTRVHQTLKKIF
jgi:endonuclease IV